MGTLIKNNNADYSAGNKYYSNVLRLAFNTQGTGANRELELYQLGADSSIITSTYEYSLAGTEAEFNLLLSDTKAGNTPAEHFFDILDHTTKRRLIIMGVGSTHFEMYYCRYYNNSMEVNHYTVTEGQTISVSLPNGITHFKLNLDTAEMVGGSIAFYQSTINRTYQITRTVIQQTTEPDNYWDFTALDYTVRIQGNPDGNAVSGTKIRFRALRLAIDGNDVCILQATPPNLFEWVSNSFFSFSSTPYGVAAITSASVKKQIFGGIKQTNESL